MSDELEYAARDANVGLLLWEDGVYMPMDGPGAMGVSARRPMIEVLDDRGQAHWRWSPDVEVDERAWLKYGKVELW